MISIIIPVYNVETYIHRCVDSVLAQTYTDWEMILVDDGSPDACPRICDEYAQKDQRIRVIHKSNGGLSSARNAGLDVMTGGYVTFLDSDDFWRIDYLKILYERAVAHKCDIVQCNYVRGNDSSFPIQSASANICYKSYDRHTIFTQLGANVILWGKLYESHLWDNMRMPIGKINEDDFTTWKLYYRAAHIAVTNEPLYYYFYNSNSIMSNQRKAPRLDFIEAYNERIAFFQKESELELVSISKWRYCLALMMSSFNQELAADQRNIILQQYHENIGAALHSQVVPLKHKLCFRLFNWSPRLCAYLIDRLYKA